MTRHAMRLVTLDGEPPAYYAHCTECDVYTSKYWNPADAGPLWHDDEPDTEDTAMPLTITSIRLIRPLRAADNFDGVEIDDATDIEASADAYWQEYRDAVAEAYPSATVEVDTPWRQYDKPYAIDIEISDGDEYGSEFEDERMAIHGIGEDVFERGTFWVEKE